MILWPRVRHVGKDMVFKAEIRKKMKVPINATIGTFSMIVLCQELTPIPLLTISLLIGYGPGVDFG